MPLPAPLPSACHQSVRRSLAARRVAFATLFILVVAAMLWLAAFALSPGGLDAVDLVLLVLFLLTLPWIAVGFLNAVIGFCIMRFARDPTAAVFPSAAGIRRDDPVTSSVAILLCIRDEPIDRLIRNLEPMLAGLDASGYGPRFHLYVLSDTKDEQCAAREKDGFSTLESRWGAKIPMTYRRRPANTGFKAGNIRDFCERWGDRHDFAVTLDADSFMTADAVLRLVRIMQAEPTLGILQGLVVGLPSVSAFARIFQFGMRLGMRSYTIGSAWWQGDCGPYWGHNAVLRLRPFIDHCRLPLIPGAEGVQRHVLSHDQIEAALMRAAGYDVRVLPEEDLGWEENPPTLIEFIRRDLRWCQGNMQYWRFLTLSGLKPTSRVQLMLAILMFAGSPAWLGMLAFGTIGVARVDDPAQFMRPDAGFMLLVCVLIMWFAPKITSAVDILLRADERRRFGGTGCFIANVVLEAIYSILLCPIVWVSHTIFLGRLLLGRGVGWGGQMRDGHVVSWRVALRHLWPQTIFGLAVIGILAFGQPAAIPYALLLAAGPALAIPFATVTSWPRVGELCARFGAGRLPEETAPHPELRALSLQALAMTAAVARPNPA
jgi:membrane glycosyltransferase